MILCSGRPRFLFAATVGLMLNLLPISVSAQETAAGRLASPGEEHAWMEPLVGNWAVEMLVYPGPGADPIVSTDVEATREFVLDGRYIREELRGTVFGNPSARDGVLGYNRLEGRFEWVTQDTFEPGQMAYFGRGDADSSGWSMWGESTEAGFGEEPTGRKRDLRFEFEIVDANYNVQRIFATFPGQEEYLFVEQRFTRKN